MNTKHLKHTDLQRLSELFINAFPTMDADEQLLAHTLYHLLAKGVPVSRTQLAHESGRSIDSVNLVLDSWPDVFFDDDNHVIGFAGLTVRETTHHFTVNNKTVYTWCAWDSLFIPALLNTTAHVTSTCPVTEKEIRLIVSPTHVEAVNNNEVAVSFLMPEENELKENVTTSFCHFVYFFFNRSAGEQWIDDHPGTFLLSLDNAFAVGKQMNAARYDQ